MDPKIDPNPFVEIKTDQKVSRKYHFFAPQADPGAQADFWMDLDRLLVALGSILVPFWRLLLPLGTFLSPFGFLFPLLVASAPFWHPIRLHFDILRPSDCNISSKILFCTAPEAARHLRVRFCRFWKPFL